MTQPQEPQTTEVVEGVIEPTPSLGRQATLVYPSPPKEFVVNGPTNSAQLYGELQAALSATSGLQIFMQQDDPEKPIGKGNNLYIEICPNSVSTATVNKVLKAHVPDPLFGVPEEQREAVQEFQSLAQKVYDGGTLTADEQATWNRYLAAQILGLPPKA